MSYLDNACLACGAAPGRPCYGVAGPLPAGVRHDGRGISSVLVRDVAPVHAGGEYGRNADDLDVTYTVATVNRVDGKKFVRFQFCLASQPDKGFFVDMEPDGACWVGEKLIALAKELTK